ncbi:MAG: CGNR zinc finger domain-containing protein [Anaerolineales bacterium]|jgi:predicted RNA-binding Zn ribbon-like protein
MASKPRSLHTGREAERHRLVGGNVSLDFVNTLNGHDRPGGHEYLHDVRDLVLWSQHAGLLPFDEVEALLHISSAHPAAAASEFRRAIRLRETLFRLFAGAARGRRSGSGDLEDLNAVWLEGQRHARLFGTRRGLALGWDDQPTLRSISRTLSSSAVALLTSADMGSIRMCSGDRCDWLFIDASRNHLRRWCSMDECGNRAKMQRRRARNRLKLAS